MLYMLINPHEKEMRWHNILLISFSVVDIYKYALVNWDALFDLQKRVLISSSA